MKRPLLNGRREPGYEKGFSQLEEEVSRLFHKNKAVKDFLDDQDERFNTASRQQYSRFSATTNEAASEG